MRKVSFIGEEEVMLFLLGSNMLTTDNKKCYQSISLNDYQDLNTGKEI